MNFLVPAFFYAAAGMAAATVALHFIVTRRPQAEVLPTVRFIPERTARSPSRALRPEDLLLLLTRVCVILLIGAAFARPELHPAKRSVVQLVLLDHSRAVKEMDEVRDSALAHVGTGSAVVVFDSEATLLAGRTASVESKVKALQRSGGAGNLSSALVAALRAASALRWSADSFEMIIISPLAREELDAATVSLRALWPGRITLRPVALRMDSLSVPAVEVRTTNDSDPLVPATQLLDHVNGRGAGASLVRIVRGTITPADLAWADDGSHTLIHWPALDAPSGWAARPITDTIGAVSAGSRVVVAPFERRWQLAATATSLPTHVVARWADGAPAATERRLGKGCLREVAIPVPLRGDLILRSSFTQLLRVVVAPCERARVAIAITDAQRATLAGTGPLAASSNISPNDAVTTPAVPWLLGLAILVAILELWIRRMDLV